MSGSLGTTDLIAIYAAAISTIVMGWEIWKSHTERKSSETERSKLRVYFGIPIKAQLPHGHHMHIFPLCVSNLGREATIVVNVEMRKSNGGYFPGA
jgi:hypothetical protein